MCFGGGKKGPSRAEEEARIRAEQQAALIEEQRGQLKAQQDALFASQQGFQQTQNLYIDKIEAITTAAMERDAAQHNAANAPALPGLVQTNNGQPDPVGADQDPLDSQRRGRRALRIDLQATAGGTSGSSLNIPRG